MLNWLITTSLKNRLLVCVFAAALVLVGGRALTNLPVDAFPDTTPVQVQINATVPSLNAEEAEWQKKKVHSLGQEPTNRMTPAFASRPLSCS